VFVLFVGVFSRQYLPPAVFVEDVHKLFDSFNRGHWTKASMGIKSWIFLKDGKPAFN